MLNVNNNVTLRKRDVLAHIVAMQFAGKLESDIDSLPSDNNEPDVNAVADDLLKNLKINIIQYL